MVRGLKSGDEFESVDRIGSGDRGAGDGSGSVDVLTLSAQSPPAVPLNRFARRIESGESNRKPRFRLHISVFRNVFE